MNPDRISMPDFDIDFCEEKRDQVFEYLREKYKGGVAHIITFGKLKARMALRDVGRVLGLPYGHVDKICKMVPFDPSRPLTLQESIDKNKPSGAKGKYWKSFYVTSTMGPSIQVDVNALQDYQPES